MEIADNELDLTDFDRTDDIERRIEAEPEPKFFTWYINFLLWKPGPILFIILWIGTIVVGILYGVELLNLTVMDFDAPPGTDGAIADDKMMQEFPSRETSQELLLYFSCSTCGSGNSAIELISTTNSTPIMSTMSNKFQEWFQLQTAFESYSDYYTTSSMYNNTNGNMTFLANSLFISNTNTSAVGLISYDNNKEKTHRTDKSHFLDDTNDKCNEITQQYGENIITVAMTGANAMAKAMTEQSKTDVGINCLLLVPVALCVLALIIRSWRLMFIPVACFTVSICASFSILRPFAEYVMDISPFCPAIMMAVTIAMSIDYSLFLLSRFVEEIERKGSKGHKPETMIIITNEAVRQTTRWSGKVIVLSGCILSLTFFGLIFYPMNLLQSVGLGSGLAIICTIVVNLTCTPSIILLFPNFFNKLGCSGCPCEKTSICCKKKQRTINEKLLIVNEMESEAVNINENEIRISNPFEEEKYEVESSNPESKCGCERCWYRCASKLTVCPWNILIVIFVYAAIAPIGYQFFSFKQQLDDTLIFPRDSIYLHTYNEISNDFSAGFLAPWNILIFAKDKHKVYTNPYTQNADMKYLTETGLIINETINKCFQNGYYLTIEGIGYIGGLSDIFGGGIALNRSTQMLLYGSPTMIGYKQVYEYMIHGKISMNRTSSYYSMTTQFDPFYENAINFVTDFRKYLYDSCEKYNYTNMCYFTGGSVGEVDMVGEIYSNVAWILSIIIGSVFCIMGCVFKSIFVPFRLFATIAIPMSFVFGLSVMVYQNGLLSFLNMESIANTDGLFWLIPIMTLSILIGLALDYDIFLFARIYEYKIMGGVSTNEAIVRGVYKTGSIITAAGVIMAISFAGLIFSQITALCQTGFILVIGVLVDTFIIRTSLVPAILSIAKEINWWPRIKLKSKEKEIKPEINIQMDASITSHVDIQEFKHHVDETM